MYEISKVLPHAAPMILLDELNSYDDMSAECTVNITRNSMLFDEQTEQVPGYVAIEYMAQAIAAYAGANDLDKGGKVSVGFLLGSRAVDIKVAGFSAGQSLSVTVNKLYQEESGLSVFESAVAIDDEVVASANINVFQPDNPDEYISQQLETGKQ